MKTHAIPKTITLTVNDTQRTVEADPSMPLLWVLRDLLDIRGPKFGCGMALCGACTVHLDGVVIRSCVTPVGSLQGKRITTIEGISADHPVKQAWKECNVPQCGYCQPGQMMSAIGLLEKHPHPSEDEIQKKMSGNICRCGTYPRIHQGIQRAIELRAKK